MSLFVVLQDHGFDRGIAFNQETCRGYKVLARYLRKQETKRSWPRTARGILKRRCEETKVWREGVEWGEVNWRYLRQDIGPLSLRISLLLLHLIPTVAMPELVTIYSRSDPWRPQRLPRWLVIYAPLELFLFLIATSIDLVWYSNYTMQARFQSLALIRKISVLLCTLSSATYICL